MATMFREFGIDNPRDRYNMANSPAGGRLSDYVGQRLHVVAWLYVTSTNEETGETTRKLVVKTPEGEVIGTTSGAFIQGFMDFITLTESDDVGEFEVAQKVSKSGRKYCVFKA